MRRSLFRWAGALALVSAVCLAGCGGTATAARQPGAILAAANQQALSSSFEVHLTGGLRVDLSHVTLAGSGGAAELAALQSELNSVQLSAVVEAQSRTTAEVTYTLPPVLETPIHALVVSGQVYEAVGSGPWYSLGSTAGAESVLPGLGNFETELKGLGSDLRRSATTDSLGDTTVSGQKVDHLRTTVAGSDLNQSMAALLGDASSSLGGAEGSWVSTHMVALEALLDFGTVQVDSYVAVASGEPVQVAASLPLTLDLSQLAGLAPGLSGLPSGSASVDLRITYDYSHWGAPFGLVKPSHVATGTPPLPDGLGSTPGLA